MYYLSPMYFLCHRPFISSFILSFASFRPFFISIAGSVLLIFLVDPSPSFHPSVFLLTRFRVTCVFPSSWFGKFSVLLIFLSSHILLLYIQYSHCFFLSFLFSYITSFPLPPSQGLFLFIFQILMPLSLLSPFPTSFYLFSFLSFLLYFHLLLLFFFLFP